MKWLHLDGTVMYPPWIIKLFQQNYYLPTICLISSYCRSIHCKWNCLVQSYRIQVSVPGRWFAAMRQSSNLIFNCVSPPVQDCINVALLCSVIDLRNLHQTLGQPDPKRKPIATWYLTFPWTSGSLLLLVISFTSLLHFPLFHMTFYNTLVVFFTTINWNALSAQFELCLCLCDFINLFELRRFSLWKYFRIIPLDHHQ